MKKKKVLSLAIAFLLMLSIFMTYHIENTSADTQYQPQDTPENEFRLVVITDPQVGDPVHCDDQWAGWTRTITQTNNYSWDIAVVIGDLIEASYNGALTDYSHAQDAIMSSNHQREDFYCSMGNHEYVGGEGTIANWKAIVDPLGQNPATSYVNDANRTYPLENKDTTNQLYYNFTVGNTIIIMLGCDDAGGAYTSSFVTWKSIVENNTDKNIITCTHHPLGNSGLRGANEFSPSASYCEVLNGTHTVNAWLSGHIHYQVEYTRINYNSNNVFNCTFVSCSSALGAYQEDGHFYYFVFTEGSNEIQVGDWQSADGETNGAGGPVIDTGVWDPDGNSGNTTINLSFPFTMNDESSVQFISIDGDENGSIIHSPNPTFNWTIATGAARYWLQISTSPTFSTLTVNLSNISKYEFPSEYSENATRVSFVLPNINALPFYSTYYCRVKALS